MTATRHGIELGKFTVSDGPPGCAGEGGKGLCTTQFFYTDMTKQLKHLQLDISCEW